MLSTVQDYGVLLISHHHQGRILYPQELQYTDGLAPEIRSKIGRNTHQWYAAQVNNQPNLPTELCALDPAWESC